MTIYVINRLDEPDMSVPEANVCGAYRTMDEANKALVDLIVDSAINEEGFFKSLTTDENHEDFPKDFPPDSKEVRDYLKSEAEGVYCIYDKLNDFHIFTVESCELA